MPGPMPTYRPIFTLEQVQDCARLVRQQNAPRVHGRPRQARVAALHTARPRQRDRCPILRAASQLGIPGGNAARLGACPHRPTGVRAQARLFPLARSQPSRRWLVNCTTQREIPLRRYGMADLTRLIAAHPLGRGGRDPPRPPRAYKTWCAKRRARPGAAAILSSPCPTGTPSRRAPSAALAHLYREVGVPALHPHDLRHLSVSLLLEGGHKVKVVRERAGHHSAAFTLDRYGHIMERDRRAAGAVSGARPGHAKRTRNQIRAVCNHRLSQTKARIKTRKKASTGAAGAEDEIRRRGDVYHRPAAFSLNWRANPVVMPACSAGENAYRRLARLQRVCKSVTQFAVHQRAGERP